MAECDKQRFFEEQAEIYFKNLRQMGYQKVNVGRWKEIIIDDGQGFPTTEYECPFCGHVGEDTNYCPSCGARLE